MKGNTPFVVKFSLPFGKENVTSENVVMDKAYGTLLELF